MSGSLEQFLTDLSRGLERTMVAVNKELTLRQRIKRTWSMRQCARFLNVSIQYLTKFANSSDDFPAGEYVGRERVFTLSELMHMRALLAASAKRPHDYLAWRKPDFARHLVCKPERRHRQKSERRAFCPVSQLALRHACRCHGC